MPEIRLNCLVVPSNCPIEKITRNHVITIKIDNSESIHSLRKQIKEKHSPRFDDIPITEFVVCAIDLNSDKKEALVNAELVINSVRNKTKIGSEQFPISNILEHFPGQPSKKDIHIIVYLDIQAPQ
ncbi:hypothetical protein C1645_740843 [Glomus cerebriforme]|uniref:Crinkler effector protein N-terminal domain-containing protein n=1 Tax=Glomus cerebriforme TaxID=658196 RepID=A0A397SJZ8_9GLOM|nr:hypothetical protein C1645_740843 [Glomus cerebriforme]